MNYPKEYCETAYARFHKPNFIYPDPLKLVLDLPRENYECAAFIAVAFSFGRVEQILRILDLIFQRLSAQTQNLKTLLSKTNLKDLEACLWDLKFRFFTGKDIANFMYRLGLLYAEHDSLEDFFSDSALEIQKKKFKIKTKNIPENLKNYRSCKVFLGLQNLHDALYSLDPIRNDYYNNEHVQALHEQFMANPSLMSAGKRAHLFLRWMVRSDCIDQGNWKCLKPEELWIPLDTHLLRHSQHLGFTSKSKPDLAAMIEVSEAFREISLEDPCKYDFSLSRMGINPEASGFEKELLALYGPGLKKT